MYVADTTAACPDGTPPKDWYLLVGRWAAYQCVRLRGMSMAGLCVSVCERACVVV